MSKMRAVQVTRSNGPFENIEREIPEPGVGQVRIKVEACGVCHSDAMTKEGLSPGIDYPRVPGHEVAGIVDAVGARVSGWTKGQRVGVGWHGGHCGYCDSCRRGDFVTCQISPQVPGITYDGGYADYMIAPAGALAAIPDGLSAVEAGLAAVDRRRLEPGAVRRIAVKEVLRQGNGHRYRRSGTLAADVALFYMRRYDQQVQSGEQLEPGNPLSFVLYTDNAARGENYGLEGTLQWRPIPSLLVDLRAAILETRYIGYQFEGRDLGGREQAHAPQYQFDVGLEYRHARGAYARIDFAGADDFYFDTSNDERAPARVLTHLKAGYSGEHWRAEVWIQNLFDRYYSQRGFYFELEPPEFTPKRYVQAGDPRHAGVTLTYSFR